MQGKRIMSTRLAALVALTATVLTALVFAGTAHAAAALTLFGCTEIPGLGYNVQISGSGFAADSIVDITWTTNEGTTLAGGTTTDGTGSFDGQETLVLEDPLNPASAFPVLYTASDPVGNTATLTVADCSMPPPPPPPDLPTTKGECKDPGWETYGVFKNHGDCVSFVATLGKNEPGKNVPKKDEATTTATATTTAPGRGKTRS